MRMVVRIKIALSALITAVVAFGATGYAGALPHGAQDVAHTLIGAPAASHSAKSKHHPNSHANSHAKTHADKGKSHGTPVGPNASGSAAYGLCNAYKHSHQHGKSLGHSIAMRNLARAAGGSGNITAYCATVPRPSSGASDEPSEPSEPSESAEPSPEPSETD